MAQSSRQQHKRGGELRREDSNSSEASVRACAPALASHCLAPVCCALAGREGTASSPHGLTATLCASAAAQTRSGRAGRKDGARPPAAGSGGGYSAAPPQRARVLRTPTTARRRCRPLARAQCAPWVLRRQHARVFVGSVHSVAHRWQPAQHRTCLHTPSVHLAYAECIRSAPRSGRCLRTIHDSKRAAGVLPCGAHGRRDAAQLAAACPAGARAARSYVRRAHAWRARARSSTRGPSPRRPRAARRRRRAAASPCACTRTASWSRSSPSCC